MHANITISRSWLVCIQRIIRKCFFQDRPKRIQYIPPSLSSDKDVENSHFSQKGKNFGKYVDTEVSCTGPGSENVNFIQDFKKSELNGTLLTRLKNLDFQTPTPVQRASIPVRKYL